MLKKMLYTSLLVSLTACGGALQSTWINFRAYNNTYYNARLYYSEGLSQIEQQPSDIDAGNPIRIHPLPALAAETEFENAIEKSSSLLRNFPESKWSGEALEIMGKSYYYLHEFYLALQQFDELYGRTVVPEARQKTIVWKGRVLFDLGAYQEGVFFLESELSREQTWDPGLRSESEMVLAEHHIQLGNWEEAVSALRQALTDAEKGERKARAFFLLGQVLETTGRYGEAEYAYSNVQNNLPGFELLYAAKMKKALVLRKRQNPEEALSIYDGMIRDDKYLPRLPEIYYEIARTEEERGDDFSAEQIYRSILRSVPGDVQQVTLADTYYRLGRIYYDTHEQFRLATAYFDSASTRDVVQEAGLFVDIQNVDKMAGTWKEVSILREQLVIIDSLLWLGGLSGEERASIVSEMSEPYFEGGQAGEQSRSNSTLNISDRGQDGSVVEPASTGLHGFLNYRNSSLLAEEQRRFRTLWGSRTLVDNWRQVDTQTTGVTTLSEVEERSGGEADSNRSPAVINPGNIPVTETEQRALETEQASIRYELGSILMLTLDRPESAVFFFRSVVEQHPDHETVPSALYALFDIFYSRGEFEEAEIWSTRLRQNHSGTVYAQRLNQRLGSSVESTL